MISVRACGPLGLASQDALPFDTRECRSLGRALLSANSMDYAAQPAVHAIGIKARVPHLRYDDRRRRNGQREALDSTPADGLVFARGIEERSGQERDEIGRPRYRKCSAEARHHCDDGALEAQRSQRFVDGAGWATAA